LDITFFDGRAASLTTDRQREWRTLQRTGKKRTRRSFLEAKDVKTQRQQIDVRAFPRCQVIVKKKEEDDFKSDVQMYHTALGGKIQSAHTPLT